MSIVNDAVVLFGRLEDEATQELHKLALLKGLKVVFKDIGAEAEHLSDFLGRGLSRFPHLLGFGGHAEAKAALEQMPDSPAAPATAVVAQTPAVETQTAAVAQTPAEEPKVEVPTAQTTTITPETEAVTSTAPSQPAAEDAATSSEGAGPAEQAA